MVDMNKLHVQKQFGANAAAYVTSKVHAKGQSLAQLVNILKPEEDWRVLDIASAAGHTAYAFAPHVRQVIASDITFEMLRLSAVDREKRDTNNVVLLAADAEDLPFSSEYFDLVTCRIAAHHFPDVTRFVRESARVLRPGGKLALVDNVVPENIYYSKKRKRKVDVGRYVNSFERLRDPSHMRCLSIIEWQQQFEQAGFSVTYQEVAQKKMDFEEWADRMNVTMENQTRLRVMLNQAPQSVTEFLETVVTGNKIEFYLKEAIMIGELPGP
jgi:ubiquinone/menaquinone biosynthesis C-methylase UbiE